MGRFKNYILSILAFMLLFAGFGIYLYANTDRAEEVYSIAVIVDDITSDRWRALRQGIDLAAKDNRVELSFVTIGKRKSVNEQNAAIDRQMQNGVDGMIIALADSRYMKKKIEQIAYQIPVLLIGTQVESEELIPVVETNHYAIGRELGREVEKKKGIQNVGIVVGNGDKLSNMARLEGVQEVLKKNPHITVLWELQEYDNLKEETAQKMKVYPVDCVITLENAATEAMIDYNLELENYVAIMGVGNTEKTVYYLDKRMIETLIVLDEFTMGYLCVEQMSQKLKYGLTLESAEIGYTAVTKDTLYSEENQKMLFPIVQ